MKRRTPHLLSPLVPLVLAAAAFAACGPRERPVHVAHPASPVEDAQAPAAVEEPSSYVLSAWGGASRGDSVPLGKSETGLLVDGVRVVTDGVRMRSASEVATTALSSVVEVPARLGGGFLFFNDTAIYHADSFDGKLKGLAYFPDAHVHAVDFGFDRALVRSNDGQRWAIRLTDGARVGLEPPGLSELAARDDGLGLVLTDTGRLLATRDAGKTYRDVTNQLRGAPGSIEARPDAIYVTSQEDAYARLEPDGRLGRVDAVPAEPVKERDPRWRQGEAPARVAMRTGVPAEEEGIAVFVANGDVFRVSLRRGEIVSVQTGKVPLDAMCEGVRTPDDALFLCTRHGQTSERFVVSGTLYGKTPQIEQSFPFVAPFSAGDDGALAFAGPCSGPQRDGVACVRTAQGSWVERSPSTDAGSPVALGYVVPRSDGGAVSLQLQTKPYSITDLATGDVRTFTDAELTTTVGRYKSMMYMGKSGGSVLREWTFQPDGSLRGWSGGRSVTITPGGPVVSTTFVGDNATYGTSGPRALGMSPEGRLFQTVDRGLTWTEVAGPPSQSVGPGSKRSYGSIQCGAVGCSLGPWLRVGFAAEPPKPPLKKVEVPPPHETKPFAEGRVLVCESSGQLRGKSAAQNDRSPGLGATYLPNGVDETHYPRGSIHPVNGGDGGDEGEPGKRAMSFVAPNLTPSTYRSTFHYILPFDPQATVRTGTLVASEVAQAIHGGPLTLDDLLSDATFSRAVPITPQDPAAPGGLLFATDRLLVAFRGGAARVGVLPEEAILSAVSAVDLPGDELGVLVSNGSQSVVFRLQKGGALTQVLEWKGSPDSERYPSNPDALAVGPRGELGVVRLASGNEPASAGDPARLLLAKGKELRLAAWSTLVMADDPACKADPSGYRATVQVTGEWLKPENAQDKPEGAAPLFARVRWSEARVCLEGVEQKAKGFDAEPGRKLERWTVMKVLPKLEAGRVVVGTGFEYRLPARCTLKN